MAVTLFHLLLVLIDIIVCTIDWKRSRNLEKLIEKEEEELLRQEEAELRFEEDDEPPEPLSLFLEPIQEKPIEESDHGLKSRETEPQGKTED